LNGTVFLRWVEMISFFGVGFNVSPLKMSMDVMMINE